MKHYIYKAVSFKYNMWTGRSKQDYLKILNDRRKDGWKFIGFLPIQLRLTDVKGSELIFEKEVELDLYL